MNCKPGDIAIIVSCESQDGKKDIGRLVSVLAPWGDGVSWKIEPCDGKGFQVGPLNLKTAGDYDWNLRPITPPPGTVTDSEVLELYSPKQREHA